MSTDERSSSRTVYNQGINIAEESKPILSKSVEILLECVKSRDNKDKFSPIYEVPNRLREVNPSSFTPRVVSIGPMHKGRANLKLMEDMKATYLYELLSEVGSLEETLRRCEKKVSDSIEKIKRYYFGQYYNKDGYSDDEFARMMVMDACFILQFINKLSTSGDVLYENRLRSRSVAVDLVLLENQIPFFVLQDIYELTLKTLKSKPSLTIMLHDLLERVNPFYEKLKISKVNNLSRVENRYHILGVLHEFYQPDQNSDPPKIAAIPAAHSAIELHKVGVRFRPNKDKQSNIPSEISPKTIEYEESGMMTNLTSICWNKEVASKKPVTPRPNKDKNWLMAVEFEQSSHKPTLRMPEVLIDNFFEVVMRNLIAYEQYSTPVKNYVTSYAMAMDMLAATPDDIAKLAESNIIRNNLGSNEKASNMISSICKDVTFPDFYYIETWEKAKKYYDSYWSKNFGLFKRKYCSTPWKAIALLAGIILFLLAVVQFIFRMIRFKSYH